MKWECYDCGKSFPYRDVAAEHADNYGHQIQRISWFVVFDSTGEKTPAQPDNMSEADARSEAAKWSADGYAATAIQKV